MTSDDVRLSAAMVILVVLILAAVAGFNTSLPVIRSDVSIGACGPGERQATHPCLDANLQP